jgi:beta-galactosidase
LNPLSRIRLTRSGLILGDREVPLISGAVHYWRIEPKYWRAALESLRAMGMRFCDTYVPWNVHEIAPGELELGHDDPRRDVAGFLRIAHELGLLVILRPGPHINAELTYFGIPERIVWDSACQAKSPRGNPVMLPAPPRMFPVPSYASEAYRDEVTRYFAELGRVLAPLCWPDGPIALCQIDNEGAMYFRDGAYDQDYHPDAIAQYRSFLRNKYGTVTALAEAYGLPKAQPADGSSADATSSVRTFGEIEPPHELAATSTADLAYYLDWAEFQEQLLCESLGVFKAALVRAGFDRVPTMHNFPPAQEATPLNAARVSHIVDFVGLDYYGRASVAARREIARRTSELAVYSEARSVPAFACEMGAGFPPIFPPLEESDSMFTVMTALAYGLRGYNAYMAVERDRWIGAPIDARGRARPFADDWRRLNQALVATDFFKLRRRVPVRLVVPRIERRLMRVTHAFGPVSPALLAIMGKGPREGCLEDDLGLGYPIAIEPDAFLRAFEEALEARGIPFALVGGEHKAAALVDARWIVCTTSGAFSAELANELSIVRAGGAVVTIGPHAPRFDGSWKAADLSPLLAGCDLVGQSAPRTADAYVARMVEQLKLPCLACDPDVVQTTVHEDEDGEERVLFVINPSDDDLVARIAVARDGVWRDVMSDGEVSSRAGLIELRLDPRTVRMLASSS